MLLSHQQHLTQASSPIRAIALPLEFAEVYSIYNGSLSTNHEHSELYLPMQDPEDQRAEDSMHPQGHIEEKEGGKQVGHERKYQPHWLNYTMSKSFFSKSIFILSTC